MARAMWIAGMAALLGLMIIVMSGRRVALPPVAAPAPPVEGPLEPLLELPMTPVEPADPEESWDAASGVP